MAAKPSFDDLFRFLEDTLAMLEKSRPSAGVLAKIAAIRATIVRMRALSDLRPN